MSSARQQAREAALRTKRDKHPYDYADAASGVWAPIVREALEWIEAQDPYLRGKEDLSWKLREALGE